MRVRAMWMAIAAVALAAGCGESATQAVGQEGGGATAARVALTGEVKEVQMLSGGGERFEPSELVARRGDVLRFVLAVGVHNVSFPEDRNPAGVALPTPSPLLQLPGQAHDITVDLPPGSYFFQCDPHVALGMTGTLTVVE